MKTLISILFAFSLVALYSCSNASEEELKPETTLEKVENQDLDTRGGDDRCICYLHDPNDDEQYCICDNCSAPGCPGYESVPGGKEPDPEVPDPTVPGGNPRD